MQPQTDTIVIGVGNPYRNDDAVGLHVVRLLEARRPTSATIIECAGETTELMEAWNGAGRVIIVDAVCSGSKPGSTRRIDVSHDALPASLKQTSTHAFGLAEAIELARALKTLPEKVIVFGVEGADFEHGQSLSPAVQQAVDRCCELILAELL